MIDFSARGCTLVDTTCGSVLNVWKNVVRYAQDGFTAVIHGKVKHEETRATASQALKYPQGRYLVVLDRDEAAVVCDYIRHGGDREAFLARFAGAVSPGFDPDVDLDAHRLRQPDDDADVGVAGDRRDGRRGDARPLRRRALADALPRVRHDLQRDAGAAGRGRGAARHSEPVDLMIVVGGYNSSNTVQPGADLRGAGAHVSHRRSGLPAVGRADPAPAGRRAVDGAAPKKW